MKKQGVFQIHVRPKVLLLIRGSFEVTVRMFSLHQGIGAEMKGEIISVGDELISGRITDTNAAFAAREICRIGCRIQRISVAPDDSDAICSVLKDALGRNNGMIIVTGGLGPTHDDVTAEAAAKVFELPLERNQAAMDDLHRWFASRNINMDPINLKQADIPQGARILPNPIGTAPGFMIRQDDCTCIFLPSVPAESEKMLENTISSMISDTRQEKSRALSIFGAGESEVAGMIEPLRNRYGEVNVHFRTHFPVLEIRFEGSADSGVDDFCRQTAEMLGSKVYANSRKSTAEALGRLLLEKKSTVALAESCTGGLASHMMTQVPGSSAYFLMSAVPYSNRAKEEVLGIPRSLISEHGAVSSNVAAEMASRVREISGADWSASITGIAGPDGGSTEKPVGLVYFGIAGPDTCFTKRRIFNIRDRQGIQVMAANMCLVFLIRQLSRMRG